MSSSFTSQGSEVRYSSVTICKGRQSQQQLLLLSIVRLNLLAALKLWGAAIAGVCSELNI